MLGTIFRVGWERGNIYKFKFGPEELNIHEKCFGFFFVFFPNTIIVEISISPKMENFITFSFGI